MAKEHIFPIFLDGDALQIQGADSAVPLTTSYVKIEGGAGGTVHTVADGTIPGQMLVVIRSSGGTQVTVQYTTPLNVDADSVVLTAKGQQCTAMWNGSAWVVLSALGAGSMT